MGYELKKDERQLPEVVGYWLMVAHPSQRQCVYRGSKLFYLPGVSPSGTTDNSARLSTSILRVCVTRRSPVFTRLSGVAETLYLQLAPAELSQAGGDEAGSRHRLGSIAQWTRWLTAAARSAWPLDVRLGGSHSVHATGTPGIRQYEPSGGGTAVPKLNVDVRDEDTDRKTSAAPHSPPVENEDAVIPATPLEGDVRVGLQQLGGPPGCTTVDGWGAEKLLLVELVATPPEDAGQSMLLRYECAVVES
ncbi:hypothetical protein R3P38DRAFT_2809442 [Favolaschia claudopus]|uniref:Uncharacterized protein n=1 Tax=Favolaschia claudopus TaxID=2862362 RepID=A0AAV9ZDQ4_9AGAR